MTVYTSADWYVKPGREEDFCAEWHELTDISVAEIDPEARVMLLRDREDPRHFRSFGEFINEEAIVRWRDGTVFGHRLGLLSEMLEHAGTALFDVVYSANMPELR